MSTPHTLYRGTFLSAGAALLVAGSLLPAQAFGALGQLDHAFWVRADAEPIKAAFRRLGFTLTPKPYKQIDGALSTFAEFGDEANTYLEIVDDRSRNGRTWTAQGTNPAQGGSYVPDLPATAAALRHHGLKLDVTKGAGFTSASFSSDSVLSNIFYYSYHRDRSIAARERRARDDSLHRHANGARGLREVWLGVPDLSLALRRFTAAGFPIVNRSVTVGPLGARGAAVGWGAHRIVLLTPTSPTSRIGIVTARCGARPVGVRIAAHMDAAHAQLASLATAWGNALLVEPQRLFGGAIAFSAENTWTT